MSVIIYRSYPLSRFRRAFLPLLAMAVIKIVSPFLSWFRSFTGSKLAIYGSLAPAAGFTVCSRVLPYRFSFFADVVLAWGRGRVGGRRDMCCNARGWVWGCIIGSVSRYCGGRDGVFLGCGECRVGPGAAGTLVSCLHSTGRVGVAKDARGEGLHCVKCFRNCGKCHCYGVPASLLPCASFGRVRTMCSFSVGLGTLVCPRVVFLRATLGGCTLRYALGSSGDREFTSIFTGSLACCGSFTVNASGRARTVAGQLGFERRICDAVSHSCGGSLISRCCSGSGPIPV